MNPAHTLPAYRSVQSHGGWHATVLKHRQQREWPVVVVKFGYEQGPGGPNDRTWGINGTIQLTAPDA